MSWPLLLLPLLLSAQGAPAHGDYGLQSPGQFHDGEPVARPGQRWLGLELGDKGATLVPVQITMTRVFDAVLDEEGQATGWQVGPESPGIVTFLRGPRLKAGAVSAATITTNPDPSRTSGQAPDVFLQRILFDGRTYRFEARCALAPDDPESPPCAIDLLDQDGNRQLLARVRGGHHDELDALVIGDDAQPSLLFAGDLDHDGKLDLILDTTDHYNVTRPTLFLSGSAGDGEMVRAVASLESVGC